MSQEARGLDPKDWVVPPDAVQTKGQAHWWLFKTPKQASYRRYDDWAEKAAAELAQLLGLPAARLELAHDGRSAGVISRNVTPDGWSLESGDTVLSDISGYVSCAADDRASNRVGHDLGNIERVLTEASGPPNGPCETWAAMEVFTVT